MTRRNRPIFALILILLATSLACNFGDLLNPSPKDPTQGASLPTDVPDSEPTDVAQEEVSPTETVEPTAEPTPEPPNEGQIVYIKEGNVWRYLVASGEDLQLTSDGIDGVYEAEYGNPHLSADGQYVAYVKNNISYIHNLSDDSIISLIHHGRFFQWAAAPNQFYAQRGNIACPAIENLEDQENINFDVLRYTLGDLDNPTMLGNVTGGLFFPQTLSGDERYISILRCACYSECGSHVINDLTTGITHVPSIDFWAGQIDFSPNSARLAAASFQIYGYIDSPLYLANPDFSGLTEIYSESGVATNHPLWSPTGEWIAFTALVLGSDDMEPTGSRVMFTNAEGTMTTTVDGGYATLVDWSPDGTQILYSQDAVSPNQLYVYDLATTATTLLPIPANPWYTDWGVLP